MTMKNKQKVYKFPREPIPLHKNLRNLYPSLVYIHVACILKTLIFTWLGGRGGGLPKKWVTCVKVKAVLVMKYVHTHLHL